MKQFLLGETSPKNKGEERLKTNTELAERRNIGNYFYEKLSKCNWDLNKLLEIAYFKERIL